MFVSAVTMARGRFAHDRREPFSKLWRPMGIVPFNPMENQPCHAKSSSLSQLRSRLPFLRLPKARPMPTGSAAAVSVAVTAVASAAWAVAASATSATWATAASIVPAVGAIGITGVIGIIGIIGVIGATIITAGTGPATAGTACTKGRRRWRPAVSGPIAAPTPGPCTCLTKTYTQDGLVVFADLCTKESASAPVGGTNSSEAAPQDPRSGG